MVFPWGAVLGAAGSLFAGSRSAASEAEAVRRENLRLQNQHAYDLQAWEFRKKNLQADRDEAIRRLELQNENERIVAEYTDTQALKQYNLNLQIRNQQQADNEAQYKKSTDIYDSTLGLNVEEERAARNDERLALEEIRAENLYEKNDAYLQYLEDVGAVRALGMTGRGVDKMRSTKALNTGIELALLNLSLDNATRSARNAIAEISRDKIKADLNALAQKMLDPGVLPMPIEPDPVPYAVSPFPRVLEEYDFGPRPIEGVFGSPAAAAGKAWTTAIPGIASDLGRIFEYEPDG
tara:strand:- start:2298 stop:3179 length:882 start_codon:yes stop_codon:yes gene_type:complete